MLYDHAMDIYRQLKAHDNETMSRRPDGTPRAAWSAENPAPVRASFRVMTDKKSYLARINHDTFAVLEIWSDTKNPKVIESIDLRLDDALDKAGKYLLPSPGDLRPHEFRNIRERLGITQKQLAPLLELGSALRVSEYERETNPRKIPGHIARLMRAYDEGFRPSDWPK